MVVPDSKIHGANVGPTWGRQDPGGPHVGHTNLGIWGIYHRIFRTLWWLYTPSSSINLFQIQQYFNLFPILETWIRNCLSKTNFKFPRGSWRINTHNEIMDRLDP